MVHSLSLCVIQTPLAIARLPGGSDVPWWAVESGEFLSLTRTPAETSVVCDARLVPESVRAERGYRAIRVDRILALSEIGVLASLATPLASADVPIFVISTYDTDYLLVPEGRLTNAIHALRHAGHSVAGH